MPGPQTRPSPPIQGHQDRAVNPTQRTPGPGFSIPLGNGLLSQVGNSGTGALALREDIHPSSPPTYQVTRNGFSPGAAACPHTGPSSHVGTPALRIPPCGDTGPHLCEGAQMELSPARGRQDRAAISPCGVRRAGPRPHYTAPGRGRGTGRRSTCGHRTQGLKSVRRHRAHASFPTQRHPDPAPVPAQRHRTAPSRTEPKDPGPPAPRPEPPPPPPPRPHLAPSRREVPPGRRSLQQRPLPAGGRHAARRGGTAT